MTEGGREMTSLGGGEEERRGGRKQPPPPERIAQR